MIAVNILGVWMGTKSGPTVGQFTVKIIELLDLKDVPETIHL